MFQLSCVRPELLRSTIINQLTKLHRIVPTTKLPDRWYGGLATMTED